VKRIILAGVVAVVGVGPTASRSGADEPPTTEQLDAAKKAYSDGKALHQQGKLVEAIDKFKESYRLSKNPLLLYNIGLTLDEAGQKDKALLYYREFLSHASQTAAQRATAADRVKALENEKLDADLAAASPTKPAPAVATIGGAGAAETKPQPIELPRAEPVKPPGTYSASDFQHEPVDSAPPGKPLDVTALVPEDSGFVVTLYFRGSGESAFTARAMKWRHKQLVARIPAAKMSGSAIQYYIEVKDAAGNSVTKSGRSTDPNLVSIDTGAEPHYYTDLRDDSGPVAIDAKRRDDKDRLGRKPAPKPAVVDQPTPTTQPVDTAAHGTGFLDVGSKKFEYTKWGATGAAGALLIGGVVFYLEATQQADNLATDSKSCATPGAAPPCRPFDSYDQSVQNAGHLFQRLSNVGFGVGAVGAAVAGYYWYRELTGRKHRHYPSAAAESSPDMTWIIVPTAASGFAGAAAAARF
jgi:hypothetical protein